MTTTHPPIPAGARTAPIAVRVVLVLVAGRTYAIPSDAVREIVPICTLSYPPSMPPLLLGVLDLGGSAVPIIRLSRLLDLSDEPTGIYTPLVILRGPDHDVGLAVGAVTQVRVAVEDDIVPLRGVSIADGAIRIGDALTPILAPDRLLLTEERHYLAHLAGIEQRRLAELRAARDGDHDNNN